MENLLRPHFPDGDVLHRAVLDRLAAKNQLYVIFFTPRSGSSWLTELAMSSGALGAPNEWFNYAWLETIEPILGCLNARATGKTNLDDYVTDTIERYRSTDRVMGIELDIYQAKMLCELMEDSRSGLQELTFFYLRRENLVAQGISLYRSVASGFWHSINQDEEARTRFQDLAFEANAIEESVRYVRHCEDEFEQLFQSCPISPRRFFYEDIVANPAPVLSWMHEQITGRAIDVNVASGGEMLRISDAKNIDWEALLRNQAPAEFTRDVLDGRPPLVRNFTSLAV